MAKEDEFKMEEGAEPDDDSDGYEDEDEAFAEVGGMLADLTAGAEKYRLLVGRILKGMTKSTDAPVVALRAGDEEFRKLVEEAQGILDTYAGDEDEEDDAA